MPTAKSNIKMNPNEFLVDRGDLIGSLPTDNTPPKPHEIEIVERFFAENETGLSKIFTKYRNALVALAVFVLLGLPIVDRAVAGFSNLHESSPYIRLASKALVFAVLIVLLWK